MDRPVSTGRYETSSSGAPARSDRARPRLRRASTPSRAVQAERLRRRRDAQHAPLVPLRRGGLLREGDNELEVDFARPSGADAASVALGSRPHANPHPYNAIRKIGLQLRLGLGHRDLSRAASWRPVRLESWSRRAPRAGALTARVDGDGTGVVDVHVDVERTGGGPRLRVRVTVGGHDGDRRAGGSAASVLDVERRRRRLWWPRGYGDQPLYRRAWSSSMADGTVLDSTA